MQKIHNPKIFIPPQYGDTITFNNINYYIGQYINRGSFGSVYECSDEWGNQLVAKVLEPNNGKSYEQIKSEWLLELNNLIQLRHPNITFVHNAFECRDTFYLIVERCDSTLAQLMSQPLFNGEIWLPYIARDILHGLEYIHSYGYVHKDLHAENIFVSKQFDFMVPAKNPVWSFKIGDLGVSNIEGNIRLFNTIMAQWMLPPEYLSPHQFGVIGKPVDIYHTGLLLLSVLLKRPLSFSNEDILAGKPRILAESLTSPYSSVISKALRRHTHLRTPSAIQMWREILSAMPK